MQSKMTLKEWLPLLGITVSAFIFNTSEFMPIGLLTDIADSFHITEAHAGVLITVYSWIVMLLSLPLMLLLNKIDFKRLLLGTIALFGIFQMLSAFSATALRICGKNRKSPFANGSSPSGIRNGSIPQLMRFER